MDAVRTLALICRRRPQQCLNQTAASVTEVANKPSTEAKLHTPMHAGLGLEALLGLLQKGHSPAVLRQVQLEARRNETEGAFGPDCRSGTFAFRLAPGQSQPVEECTAMKPGILNSCCIAFPAHARTKACCLCSGTSKKPKLMSRRPKCSHMLRHS